MSASPKNKDVFAFGANEFKFCKCPAMSVGKDPAGMGDSHVPGLLGAAEKYDDLLQEQKDDYEGLVMEEEAREAWIEMIEWAIEGRDKNTFEAALQVAVELGWVEEEDYEL